jgi:hypothetical protein
MLTSTIFYQIPNTITQYITQNSSAFTICLIIRASFQLAWENKISLKHLYNNNIEFKEIIYKNIRCISSTLDLHIQNYFRVTVQVFT